MISSGNGAECLGEASEYLESKGIAQRFKPVGDTSALGMVDKAIPTPKVIMAKMMADSSKSWVEILPNATAAYNQTPKGQVLHGDAPAEVRDDPQVKFMLLQDNARKLQHN